jgi:NTE family protein
MHGLILGGGGLTGIAWMTGILHGLHERGFDALSARQIIGTSAGSAVGAQITSGLPLSELFERQTDPARQSRELSPTPQQLQALATNLLPLLNIEDGAERTRRIAKLALEADTVDERTRRAVIEARLPSHEWSDYPLRIVAVDTENGESKLFDRGSGEGIVDAVAASCAVPGIWPPVSINGHRYMDGGIRTPENADLASACTTLLVLSPIGLNGNAALRVQLESLQNNSVRVRLIEPDAASKAAIGLNPFDTEKRTAAAQAGRRQGHERAKEIVAFWE